MLCILVSSNKSTISPEWHNSKFSVAIGYDKGYRFIKDYKRFGMIIENVKIFKLRSIFILKILSPFIEYSTILKCSKWQIYQLYARNNNFNEKPRCEQWYATIIQIDQKIRRLMLKYIYKTKVISGVYLKRHIDV